MKLYSYIVVSDNGYAPTQRMGFARLLIVSLRCVGLLTPAITWLGWPAPSTGKRVATYRPIIYAMRVTDVCSFEEFKIDERYRGHLYSDSNAREEEAKSNRALISNDFVYWGGDGPSLPPGLTDLIVGRGHKRNFPLEVVRAFVQ